LSPFGWERVAKRSLAHSLPGRVDIERLSARRSGGSINVSVHRVEKAPHGRQRSTGVYLIGVVAQNVAQFGWKRGSVTTHASSRLGSYVRMRSRRERSARTM
jgi:hypothetical protein